MIINYYDISVFSYHYRSSPEQLDLITCAAQHYTIVQLLPISFGDMLQTNLCSFGVVLLFYNQFALFRLQLYHQLVSGLKGNSAFRVVD